MEVFHLSVIFLFVCVSSVQSTVCTNNTKCSIGECCFFEPEFLVVSKRQEPQPPIAPMRPTIPPRMGVCEKYLLEHERCNYLDVQNGHCGCDPGLSCRFIPKDGPPTQDELNELNTNPWINAIGSSQCVQI